MLTLKLRTISAKFAWSPTEPQLPFPISLFRLRPLLHFHGKAGRMHHLVSFTPPPFQKPKFSLGFSVFSALPLSKNFNFLKIELY